MWELASLDVLSNDGKRLEAVVSLFDASGNTLQVGVVVVRRLKDLSITFGEGGHHLDDTALEEVSRELKEELDYRRDELRSLN
jgi:GGDEF domain-containing protein